MGANAESNAEVQNELKGAGLLESVITLLTLFTPPPCEPKQPKRVLWQKKAAASPRPAQPPSSCLLCLAPKCGAPSAKSNCVASSSSLYPPNFDRLPRTLARKSFYIIAHSWALCQGGRQKVGFEFKIGVKASEDAKTGSKLGGQRAVRQPVFSPLLRHSPPVFGIIREAGTDSCLPIAIRALRISLHRIAWMPDRQG